MITYDHHRLRLFGIPFFTLVVGILFVAAIAGLLFGLSRWGRPSGKVAVLVSTFVLLLFVLAIILVLVTVGSGSMG